MTPYAAPAMEQHPQRVCSSDDSGLPTVICIDLQRAAPMKRSDVKQRRETG